MKTTANTGGRVQLFRKVLVLSPKSRFTAQSKSTPTRIDFAHYTIDFDGMIEIAVITNGTQQEALSVINGLDLAAIHAALPGYETGAVAAN